MGSSVVDAHVHVIPRPALQQAREGTLLGGARIVAIDGVAHVTHPEGYRYVLSPAFHDLDELASDLNRRGAARAVVSPAPPLFGYALSPGVALRHVQAVNDGVAEMVAAGPWLRGLAILPMASPVASARELARAVDELGLVGAEIGPHIEGRSLDDDAFRPVLEAAEALNTPLFLHPYYTGARPGLEDLYLTNLVGNPLDTCVAAARLVLSGALDRFPRLTIVLAHAGGYLPYQVGRLDHGNRVRPELGRCALEPSAYMRRFLYDTITFQPRSLRFLADLVGADRILYGSDAPFDMSAGGLHAQTAGAGLSPDELKDIGGRTADGAFVRAYEPSWT